MQIGLVGTGVIGASWAALFLASGHRVRAFDLGPQSARIPAPISIVHGPSWKRLMLLSMAQARAYQLCLKPEKLLKVPLSFGKVCRTLPLKIETFQRRAASRVTMRLSPPVHQD